MTLSLFDDDLIDPTYFERQLRRQGTTLVAGIDEAGRGPLAGPVVAAAVILPEHFDLPGLNDSKKLTEKKREQLFGPIRQQALAVGVGFAHAEEIDEINILQATVQSMCRAVARLKVTPQHLLIDGITPLPLSIDQQTIKKGDSRSLSVAAASVIAKVVRDRMMKVYARHYPDYGFEGHKGYGSARHRQLIAEHGPCPLHRKTFGGVREHL
ncbi:ribonuclease HII [Desulfuromonas acetoxidans]|uniref:Ribonuclease HII n=1 Tax=Desulfuromonas acetoxidans (strain DSM 684 / 11070) TaxID=281689 RepID=Q1JX97_DESA6|nr:Ribonuclease H [Desulfuromonas acetoxidans DSM 684]MBF0645552.1 ribonuclease HII [Desulfuromonas acetoxidans]NVD23354.1 ribonuclease HII [Desulfuromonas acetoxidans]NVE15405.1 ribonuclease HII [Desulfuromonas acetoxidans]